MLKDLYCTECLQNSKVKILKKEAKKNVHEFRICHLILDQNNEEEKKTLEKTNTSSEKNPSETNKTPMMKSSSTHISVIVPIAE